MCNVHDDGGELQPKLKERVSVGKKCMKCERAAVTTARTKDPFCKECFTTYFVHRFRATFGKVRLFTTGERVLLAFSGGVNSRVLLALAEEGLKLSVYKKLRFEPTVIIIDEGVVVGQSWSERCRQLSQCVAIAATTGFHTIFTHIEQVFGECAVQSLDQLLSTGAPDSMPPQAPSSSLDENRDTSRKSEGQVVKASSASVTGTDGLEVEDDETNGFFAVLEQNVDEGGSEDRGEVEGGCGEEVEGGGGEEVEGGGGEVVEGGGGEVVEGERDRVESGKEGVVGSEGGESVIVESGSDGRNDRGSGEVDGEDVVGKGESGEGVEGGGGREVKGESGEGVDIANGALREEVLYQQLLEGKKEESLEQQVRALFASCSSTTAQESLLLSLRRQLLVEIARKQGCSKVLIGDTATRLAVRLLGNVAQGRGQTLPLDTGFIDDRMADVALIRPLREFPVNEVAMYATLNGLHSLSIPHLTTLAPEQVSIERLTESFVAGLQADFPSTVSTVFRTGDKLTVGGGGNTMRQSCVLCQAPVGPQADPSVFTHLSQADRDDPHLWTHMCYGCQLTMKDVKCDSSTLPQFVQHSTPQTQSEMLSRVKDYLFEDSSS